MKTIWKFPIPRAPRDRPRPPALWGMCVIEMPRESRILTVQAQNGVPVVWAVVDPAAPTVSRKLLSVATGQHSPGGDYVNTFQMNSGALVFHVFDLGEVQEESS